MQSLENLLVGNKSQIHTLLKRWTDCFASQVPCDHFVNIDGLLINLNSVVSWFTDDLKFRNLLHGYVFCFFRWVSSHIG